MEIAELRSRRELHALPSHARTHCDAYPRTRYSLRRVRYIYSYWRVPYFTRERVCEIIVVALACVYDVTRATPCNAIRRVWNLGSSCVE